MYLVVNYAVKVYIEEQLVDIGEVTIIKNIKN